MQQLHSKLYLSGLLFLITAGLISFLAYSQIIDIPFITQTTSTKEMVTQKVPTQKEVDLQIKLLSNVEPDFEHTRAFFVDLSKAKGSVYAFEVLKQAPLPPNTDLHLLGHAIGDELYIQEGLDGMQYCTHDFRNACSHSVVIGALLLDGMDVFNQVHEACKKAPGGSGAYTMCFHGFGHGVLAFTEYEIPEAVSLCERVGTEAYAKEEAAQCIGGMVMEMFQGIHDPEMWEQKKDKYLNQSDPLKMCTADYMPEYAKVLCFSYITPFIFSAAGAQDGSNPDESIYAKSFKYCDVVLDDRQRQSCYGGLGKEFIVLSQDRDIRKMEETPDTNLTLSSSWCMLAASEEAQTACILSILDSLYWGGENDPTVSVRHCTLLEEGKTKDSCFGHLFEITTYYQNNSDVRKKICSSVPKTYGQECNSILLK